MTQKPEEPGRTSRQFGWITIIPLVVFLVLATIFYSMLSADRDPSKLPSALLEKPAPRLELAPLADIKTADGTLIPGIGPETLDGGISIINVFASWCVPCRDEHPQIMAFAADGRFRVVGVNYKDKTQNALDFLNELGNPYDVIGVDRNGRGAIEWGVYGIPETFFVDADGLIFHKHVGPISRETLEQELLPLLDQKF